MAKLANAHGTNADDIIQCRNPCAIKIVLDCFSVRVGVLVILIRMTRPPVRSGGDNLGEVVYIGNSAEYVYLMR